jgi:hypothetical protein
VASSWKIACGLGYFARTIIDYINRKYSNYVHWGIIWIDYLDKPEEKSWWPDEEVIAMPLYDHSEQYVKAGITVADGDWDIVLIEHEFGTFHWDHV